MERKKGEPQKPDRAPFYALDLAARLYLEDETTGGKLTLIERDVFLELVKNPGPLENYARGGSTDSEIAAILGLPLTAIKVFDPVLAKSRALLNNRIRDAMLKAADKAEPVALNYLASVYLEAHDA